MKRMMIFILIVGGMLSAFTAAAQDSSGVSIAGRYDVWGRCKSLALSEELAYIGTYSNTLDILDITDPQEIDDVGSCNVGYTVYDVVQRDETAFLCCVSAGFKIVDVQDPADPRLLASLELPGYVWGVDLVGDYALVAAGYLRVIDISDPARPEQVAVFDPGDVRAVAVSGEFAYLAGDRFYVVDISDPEEPHQVASLNLPLYGWQITLAEDRAYVAEVFNERQGDDYIYHSNLRIFDISDPEDPSELGVFGELPIFIYNVAVTGNHAYLAASSHLRVLDISDPENPSEVGYYRTSGTAYDVAVSEPFAYVAQYDFVIYDCSNAIGEPDLEIAEEDRAHDFGDVVVGLSEQWSFPIQNAGHFQLTIDRMEVDDEAFVLRCDRSRWRWQGGFPAGATTRDQRLGGVEFDGENFYITGGNNGDMVNWVYVFNSEGEQVRRFEQFAESPWGMRDLAWDGELLWGADGATVYGFTTEGELQAEFRGPVEVVRSLAWDSQRELLWLADLTSPIFGVDREGNIAVELDRPGVRVYGMGWYPEDTDGCQLYLATWDPDRPLSLHKVDVESGEVFIVRENLDARIGERFGGGLMVTDDLNPPCWDIVALVDGAPDAVEVWQLTDYYRDDPVIIPAEDEALVTVEFAPGEAQEYEGTLTIISNDEEELEVQVSLAGAGRINRAPEWSQLPEAVETRAGELIQFEVQGCDPDENQLLVTLERGELPYRARLEDHGDGSATFSWQTDERDVGRHASVFILSDRVSEVQGEVPLVVGVATGVANPPKAAPFVYRLDNPQPNPFNSTLRVGYSLPMCADVELNLYDLSGRLVAELVDGRIQAGVHSVLFDGSNLASGIYMLRYEAAGNASLKKVVLVK